MLTTIVDQLHNSCPKVGFMSGLKPYPWNYVNVMCNAEGSKDDLRSDCMQCCTHKHLVCIDVKVEAL
jgi:hypothetical protein